MPLFSRTLAASAALALALVSPRAHAHSNGFAVPGCSGCHNGAAKPSISLQVSPESPAPGETVTIDVGIKAVNGSVGGLYVLTDGRGKLVNVSGQGTHLLDESRLVHSAPKQASGDAVHFKLQWIAPDMPGGVVLKVWGVSANGDQKSKGDGGEAAVLSFAYGCQGITYYGDHDGDGYGGTVDQVVDCAPPPSYSTQSGDCDESNPIIHPEASEICNGLDDDCDGQVDENLEVTKQYEDADGDGHGSIYGDVVMAKCPPAGYAPTRDDCNDMNPSIYVGAPEACNYMDDDCDDRIDENVREICGIGMCARLAITCDAPILCTPGDPMEETCNLLDDDCDGAVDEGADVCEAGLVCETGACVPGTAAPAGSEDAGVGSGCAVDSKSAPPGGMLLLLSPLLIAWRRLRRRRADPAPGIEVR